MLLSDTEAQSQMKFTSAPYHTAFSFILRIVNTSPMKRIKLDKWGWALSRLAAGESAGRPLISWITSACLFSFVCFQKLSRFPDSKLIHHWGGLDAEHCVPFSADQWASRKRLLQWKLLCESVRSIVNGTPRKESPSCPLFPVTPRPLPLPGALDLI